MLIRSKIATAATTVAAMLLSVSAYAGAPPLNLPEPGTWALLGLAAAIGIAVTRKKRK